MNFKEKVIEVVRKIPKGKTLTYGQVASLAGSPRASRAVGTIMKNNEFSIIKVGESENMIPCHRVIRSDGKIGEYNGGGAKVKLKLLQSEGVLLTIKSPNKSKFRMENRE